MLAVHALAPALPAPQATPHRLDVFAFGNGRVFVDGHEVILWDGPLPRSLFFYLIDRPLATRDELFAQFWPQLAGREATNVFHVTKRKMTERISAPLGVELELTRYASGYYLPGDNLTRHYDVFAFHEAIHLAEQQPTPAEAAIFYRRALALYRGPFLRSLQQPWAIARREQFRTIALQALSALIEHARQRGRLDEAIGWATRALYEAPDHAEPVRQLCALYRESGRHAEAAALNDRLSRPRDPQ